MKSLMILVVLMMTALCFADGDMAVGSDGQIYSDTSSGSVYCEEREGPKSETDIAVTAEVVKEE